MHYELTPLMVDIGVSDEHSLVNTIIRICAGAFAFLSFRHSTFFQRLVVLSPRPSLAWAG